MKFVDIEHIESANREFEIYAYLDAINNTKVEEHGFPTIYYYNVWEMHIVMVMSFFEGGDLIDKMRKGFFKNPTEEIKSIDSLILFRNFVG